MQKWVWCMVLVGLTAGCASDRQQRRPPAPETAAQPSPSEQPRPATAPTRPVAAVFDVEGKGATLGTDELDRLSEFVAVVLVESGRYRVVPRSQVRRRLQQQKKASYKECFDQRCQIEIGRELAAQKIISTKVLRLGSRCTVAMAVYDLRTATADRAARQDGECDPDAVAANMVRVIRRITGRLKPQPERTTAQQDEAPLEQDAQGLYGRENRKPATIKLRCDDCILDEDPEEAYRRFQRKIRSYENKLRYRQQRLRRQRNRR